MPLTICSEVYRQLLKQFPDEEQYVKARCFEDESALFMRGHLSSGVLHCFEVLAKSS